MEEKNGISRRSFLKGTAVGAAGLATSGVLATTASALGTEKTTPTTTTKKKLNKKVKPAAFVPYDTLSTVDGKGQIRYRWNGCVFNEIVLPNGKVIVTDPYWYGINNQYIADNTVKAGKWVSGCDYLLLTHIHGDHVADVPSVLDYYPLAEVVLPLGGMPYFCSNYNVGPMAFDLIGVVGGQHLEFEDFSLDVFGGRHTFNTNQAVHIDDNKTAVIDKWRDADGRVDAEKMHSWMFGNWGTSHFCNYLITTKPEGFKILIYGGRLMYDPFRYQYVGMKPDLMFYQAANPNLGNPYWGTDKHIDLNIKENIKTDDVANFVASVEAGSCMPSHQEKFSMENLKYIAGSCAEKGIAAGIQTQYFVPNNNEWYVFNKDKYTNITIGKATDIPPKKPDPSGLSTLNR